MGITANFGKDEIRDHIEGELRKHIVRIVEMLKYVGQTVVNEIRTSHISNWNDQTGNLRSSIGYTVLLDGVPQVTSAFERVDGPQRGDTNVNGSAEGSAYIRSLTPLHREGIALIVVAGMEYASYVEKLKNKTVLAQGEIEAQTLINKMLAQLDAKLGNKE